MIETVHTVEIFVTETSVEMMHLSSIALVRKLTKQLSTNNK